MDPDPKTINFPFGYKFSNPAIYYTPNTKYKVGDTVFYEVNLQSTITSSFSASAGGLAGGGIQWGEAVVVEIFEESDTYRLAGKCWNYDHFVHPFAGAAFPNKLLQSKSNFPGGSGGFGFGGMVGGGPPAVQCPLYQNLGSAKEGRSIYKQWAQNHHPNSTVRQAALHGEDRVLHPALSCVPGEAMFKVWDRDTIPQCPIRMQPSKAITTKNQKKNDDDDNNNDDNVKEMTERPITLEQAKEQYGSNLQFQGVKQKGHGPEMWGVTFEQLESVKKLPGYNSDMSMYDVVVEVLVPLTKGKGMGYALMINEDEPLRATQMTSHAWGEKYEHFVQAIRTSKSVTGPFWVCALAIYQCEDIPELTISKQLGPSLENGPFATVLKQATDMIAVFTPAADIYLRMWCVFEISIAVKYGVPVRFAALSGQFRSGIENIYDAIYEHGKNRCDSEKARCGDPKESMNDDEKMIRHLINEQPGSFARIDSTVEWCKAVYHIQELHHPGSAFKSDPAHLILLGGRSKYDFLAKTLSSIALAMDRITIIEEDFSIDDTSVAEITKEKSSVSKSKIKAKSAVVKGITKEKSPVSRKTTGAVYASQDKSCCVIT